jgi:hypothetical protein
MVDDRSAVPGIYVCRVEVQADAGKEVETLLVNVAY